MIAVYYFLFVKLNVYNEIPKAIRDMTKEIQIIANPHFLFFWHK